MRQNLPESVWNEIHTAYASGIGLRELARNAGIPAGTVLARAKREKRRLPEAEVVTRPRLHFGSAFRQHVRHRFHKPTWDAALETVQAGLEILPKRYRLSPKQVHGVLVAVVIPLRLQP
jgi:hypothetical protein